MFHNSKNSNMKRKSDTFLNPSSKLITQILLKLQKFKQKIQFAFSRTIRGEHFVYKSNCGQFLLGFIYLVYCTEVLL